MNSRIYPSEIFEKEFMKIQGKIYCPNCYSFNINSYFPYIESKKRGSLSCKICNKRCKLDQLLTTNEVRDKKINEVIKK